MASQLEEVDSRRSAVSVLGSLFSEHPDLASQYHKNYTDFLERFHDKDAGIRSAMVAFGVKLLRMPPAIAEPAAGAVCMHCICV